MEYSFIIKKNITFWQDFLKGIKKIAYNTLKIADFYIITPLYNG